MLNKTEINTQYVRILAVFLISKPELDVFSEIIRIFPKIAI